MRSSKTALPPTNAAAVQRIVKLLDQSRASTGLHTYEHFRRALGVWDAVTTQAKMGPWLEACRDLEFGLEPLVEALAILVDQAARTYQDVLGAVYMELGQADKRFGQFFTPWAVAKLMAEVAVGDLQPREPGQPPLRFMEPCIGSGVFFLAAAEVIETRYPGMIARGEVEFRGSDIDPVCVAMATLNLRIHGIGRRIERLEALRPEQRRALETLLGVRLPATGPLLLAPALRQTDVLTESPALPDPVALPAAAGESTPTSDAVISVVETPADSALVTQDLWVATGISYAVPPPADPVTPPTRKGRMRSERRVGGAAYTQGALFGETASPPLQGEARPVGDGVPEPEDRKEGGT